MLVDNECYHQQNGSMPRQLEERTFVLLVRAAEWLLQGTAEILRQHDLTYTRYHILRILHGAGEDGLTCSEIGGRMLQRDPDVTRLLDRLEKRDLLQRERSTTDRRVVITRITPAGATMLAAIHQPILAQHQRSMRHLTRSQLQQSHRLLEALHQPAA